MTAGPGAPPAPGGTEAEIGIVGSYGDVGAAAAAWLRDAGAGRLRLGGRDAARAESQAKELGGARALRVDAADPAALARFCAGCDIVVNCAGPARVIGTRVAAAAHAAGAAYVDAAGDDPLHAALGALSWSRPAVVSAGMMPGLSGLLPRLLADPLVPGSGGRTLEAYVGGRDTFTAAAALDYLGASGAGYGAARAAWRDGRRVAGALGTRTGVRPPRFPDRVTAVPYLSTETERLAARLELDRVDWWSAFPGEHVVAALSRGAAGDEAALRAAADGLRAAAELDCFGHDRYQLMVFGLSDGARTRTLALRAVGAGALSGTTAGLAALAVAGGLVGPGVHHLADALDPRWAVDLLRGSRAVTALEVFDGDPDEVDEEGTI
ncbi:saccharopine dehydrogenase NADP-binding domain-containing protein [Sphaerimonospora mesophila]|uniref:saccharopine dehydrogenase NADP-binding domain-containing protein n=1 Tax=Sphaerimonospora mesophila TaxID=37483 RepID=UPI0006E22D4D